MRTDIPITPMATPIITGRRWWLEVGAGDMADFAAAMVVFMEDTVDSIVAAGVVSTAVVVVAGMAAAIGNRAKACQYALYIALEKRVTSATML